MQLQDMRGAGRRACRLKPAFQAGGAGRAGLNGVRPGPDYLSNADA